MSDFRIMIINQTPHTLVALDSRGTSWSGYKREDVGVSVQPAEVAWLHDPTGDAGNPGNNWGWLDYEVGAGGNRIQVYAWHGHSRDAAQLSVGWYNEQSSNDNPQPAGALPGDLGFVYLNAAGNDGLIVLGGTRWAG
ncbi:MULTISPECIES: hypothetical protein [Nocardiaceae]|uniref:Fucose-specific lectin n=1 Tax=Rhodococcoides kroppenstedtii TaxID=293050 RepID=A0ABS7NU91_9NOCA|nr:MULTISPECIES: hypothetical protein [Rhodococcus]AMY20891.1 hypothetical protein A3Q40_03532 [Rhodococcus sp. PBTS 1]MBY6313421.1 hypothetical protein [Rhodococcus kroppenstedtii]MBY6321573.1 hypothetical protein [Rhodococcus kroppenstedtii]MBY6400271.1 hypothetical protein [Rhodococcus kroppenstedtii]MBY6436318.1 hypothetical protein [Rhodococcus kroppenstedtii]